METNNFNPVPIYGSFLRAVKSESDDILYHEFVISNETIDRHGTVFKTAGWELDEYNRTNPVVTYAHKDNDGNPDMVIGRSEVFIENNQVIGRVYYEPADINPVAEKVKRKVEHGTLRMASINAIPKKGHYGDEKRGEKKDVLYFDQQELLAWSIVPIGSNRAALKRSAEAFEEIKTKFTRDIKVEGAEVVPAQNNASIREAQLLININRSK